jgi:aldose 1-epimerase
MKTHPPPVHATGQRVSRRLAPWFAVLLAGLLHCAAAGGAEAAREAFGALDDGRPIEAVTLSNSSGMRVRIMTLGATIQSLATPDRNGRSADVVLGFDTAQEYLSNHGYFGATVGRFANRIANARFSLDSHEYSLVPNDHGNSLHGGDHGFDKAVWKLDSARSGARAEAVFSYVSADGEQGYPGTLRVTASYLLDEHNVLAVEYRATTDKPTVVNISNHSYFNLLGAGATAMNHRLEIPASRYTPVDERLIPTGELRSVAGTPFDFRVPTAIGLRVRDARDPQIRFGRGYDHNFALDGAPGTLRLAARLIDPDSGRVMAVYTDAPGVQFYSGNFLDGTVVGRGATLYREGDGLALEPQLFPDAPNQPGFASARLDPGAIYRSRIEYRFSTRK